MKPKKSAFANTSTGYGRQRGGLNKNQSSSNKHTNGKSDSKGDKSKDEKLKNPFDEKVENDKDLNSGFGDYLRSPEAVEMMKLFVFANSIMLIVTMAWPNIKEQYYWVRQWWEETFQQY